MFSMQSLEGRFIYFTECQLATLEGLKMKKSSSKSDISRHQSIADKMIEVCKCYYKDVDVHGCPRVKQIMEKEKTK